MSDKKSDAGTKADAPQKEDAPAESSGGLRAGIAAWGLVLYSGCRAIDLVLEAQSLAAAVGQAVLVEWGSSRLGVAWTAPGESGPSTKGRGEDKTTSIVIARRALIGAAVGLVAAAALFAVLLASGAATFERVASFEVSVLAIGLATAALHAWRDELLLHGITLRALDSSVNDVARVLACGATSAGAALGRGDATPRTVVASTLLGLVFGALWVRDRGAWQPWAAHTAFRFATGTLLAGGVVHSRLADNAWGGGSAGILGGTAATIALAPVAMLAVVWTARRMSPRSPAVG